MTDTESLLKDCFSVAIVRFKDRIVGKSPWLPRSILMSEAFAFCAIAEMLGIDAIVESGVYHGRSTHVWANFFDSNIPIMAIERKKFRHTTISRLEPFKNVSLFNGDGLEKVPALVDGVQGERVAIMLDGPKNEKALCLAENMMAQPKVAMIAIHDMYRYLNGVLHMARMEFEKWKSPTFFSDRDWFIEEYGWLDKDESHFDKVQGLTWEPYIMKGTGRTDWILGSYGMTLGISFKEEII